jgi:RecA-family ATPase
MAKVIQMPNGLWGNDADDWLGTAEEWRGKMRLAEEQADVIETPDDSDASPPRFTLMHSDELANRPCAENRIKQVLPAQGIAVIYGPPKSGKTFLALDLAAAITEGRNSENGKNGKNGKTSLSRGISPWLAGGHS